MTDVEHMKWWGWGVDGIAFHHEDKPGFAPIVKRAIDMDLWSVEPARVPEFSELNIADSLAPAGLVSALEAAVGAENVTSDAMDRVVHVYGKSLRDLVRIRAGLVERYVDLVVYPGTEEEVAAVVRIASEQDAVLIPFGGGSNIVGSLEPLPGETRPVISLDLGRMNRVLSIDEDSRLATVQAGVLGPKLEEQLNAQGWTMGHFPDSFTHSSLGGWIATRSSGMQSDKYGDIADITRGLRVVRPEGVLVLRPYPSVSNGPSLRELILGSEGRLGVITEATVQVHRVAQERGFYGYLFKTFDDGLAAIQEIAESDLHPITMRISDANETAFSFATSKESKGVSKKVQDVLMSFLEGRGWNLDEICLSFMGFEGSPDFVKRTKAGVDRIVRRHHGVGVGKGPGVLYDQKKFDTPYLRDFLLDRGAAGDVSETPAPWSKLRGVHANAYAAAQDAYAKLGKTGWIMSHMSHSYHAGACLYFTFAFQFGDDPLGEYDVVKRAIQESFIVSGAAVSHHHGVGLEHAHWLEDDVSAEGTKLLTAVFEVADPGRNLNPGKLVP